MSRTYRRCSWDNWSWRASPFADFQYACVEPHDGYIPRLRHTRKTFPYLTSTYDDVYPSALTDNWNCGKNRHGVRITKSR